MLTPNMNALTRPEASQLRQLRMFGGDGGDWSLRPDNAASHFSDPSFASNKTRRIHRWVPWIAGFSSRFVRDALQTYLSRHGTVLDPFCGVGTTLLEAVLAGHEAIGFEINPYAVMACRTKVNAHRIAVADLRREITRLRAFYHENTSRAYVPKSTPPEGFRTRAEFYSPRVLRKVLMYQDFVETVQDSYVKCLLKLAFASTMVRYSNYSYEPSLGRRVSAGKPEIHDFPVGTTLLDKLSQMAEDVAWFQRVLPDPPPSVQIVSDSFFTYQSHVRRSSVDLIITSPPYLNNYHYNRNTRPHLYWLGYAKNPRDLRPLERSNFGKYWQTVREQDMVELDFSLPGTDLAERLQTLRRVNPEKGIYGGNGWANYAASYFNDCQRFARGIRYTLRPGGRALVVIGNSILQGILIPTDRYFGSIAESVGLELVRIDVPRATRVGNSIIQSGLRVPNAKKSHRLYEAVVELTKRGSL